MDLQSSTIFISSCLELIEERFVEADGKYQCLRPPPLFEESSPEVVAKGVIATSGTSITLKDGVCIQTSIGCSVLQLSQL